ncbi:MAG: hypothetical protein US81_C0009G0023 [Parcubacteria group bacterium GW2011_GWE2_38_18]|nr:MAG: hypothetical protein US81_C0009G0023 [Parcubacteria group bacterium GW2011_GWE2_38_18]
MLEKLILMFAGRKVRIIFVDAEDVCPIEGFCRTFHQLKGENFFEIELDTGLRRQIAVETMTATSVEGRTSGLNDMKRRITLI